MHVSFSRVVSVLCAALLGMCLVATNASAQTKVRFQFDWRFEGSSAIFLNGEHKGYFKDAGLALQLDPGSGSANTVNLVAAGTYDMGFADLSTLMEFHGNNPDAPAKPVAVMLVYNTMPATVFALRKSGIQSPRDLKGKRIGAPVFDAGRRAFPLFAAANGLGRDDYRWESMDGALRETLLARGDIDAITGFYHNSLLNLQARGVAREDIVAFPFGEHGVDLYGSAVIASPDFVARHPEAVKAFLRAFTRSVRDAIQHPDSAIAAVKLREPIINEALELKRLQLLIATGLRTSAESKEGFGRVDAQRLGKMSRQVTEVYATKVPVEERAVWDGRFLPSAAELRLY